MECSFEDRKHELIAECKLPNGVLDAVRERLRTFYNAGVPKDRQKYRIDVRDGEKSPLIVEALMRRVQTGRGKNTAEKTLVTIRYCDRENVVVKVDYNLGYAFGTT